VFAETALAGSALAPRALALQMQHARAFALLVAVCPATALRTLRAVFSTSLSLIENTFEESDSGILIVQIARVVAHHLPSSSSPAVTSRRAVLRGLGATSRYLADHA